MTWGEMLVDVTPDGQIDHRVAEEHSSNADATEWKFKIRSGVEFHNGQTLTAEDVVATLKRHTDEKAQSGALGIVQGITEMKAEGDMVTLKLAAGNADLPYLMGDYHLVIQPGGGVDNPAAAIGAGPYKVVVNEPGVRHGFEKHANYFDSTHRPCGSGRDLLVINDSTARTAALAVGPGADDQPGGPQDRRPAEERAADHDQARSRAAGTMSSSCMWTSRPSTTATCAWR